MAAYTSCALALVIGFSLSSCSSSPFKGWALNPMSSAGLLRDVEPQIPSYSLPAFIPEEINFDWLESADFFPPDAVRLPDAENANVQIAETERISCPGSQTAVSPIGYASLHCDMSPPGTGVAHRLMLTQKDARVIVPVFFSGGHFEAIWSTDGVRFLVSHVQPLRSSMTTHDIRTGITSDIVISGTTLGRHVPIDLLDARIYVRALGWSDESNVVVRVMGRTNTPPFDEFGVELLIDIDNPSAESNIRILRGFTRRPKEQSPKA